MDCQAVDEERERERGRERGKDNADGEGDRGLLKASKRYYQRRYMTGETFMINL